MLGLNFSLQSPEYFGLTKLSFFDVFSKHKRVRTQSSLFNAVFVLKIMDISPFSRLRSKTSANYKMKDCSFLQTIAAVRSSAICLSVLGFIYKGHQTHLAAPFNLKCSLKIGFEVNSETSTV